MKSTMHRFIRNEAARWREQNAARSGAGGQAEPSSSAAGSAPRPPSDYRGRFPLEEAPYQPPCEDPLGDWESEMVYEGHVEPRPSSSLTVQDQDPSVSQDIVASGQSAEHTVFSPGVASPTEAHSSYSPLDLSSGAQRGHGGLSDHPRYQPYIQTRPMRAGLSGVPEPCEVAPSPDCSSGDVLQQVCAATLGIEVMTSQLVSDQRPAQTDPGEGCSGTGCTPSLVQQQRQQTVSCEPAWAGLTDCMFSAIPNPSEARPDTGSQAECDEAGTSSSEDEDDGIRPLNLSLRPDPHERFWPVYTQRTTSSNDLILPASPGENENEHENQDDEALYELTGTGDEHSDPEEGPSTRRYIPKIKSAGRRNVYTRRQWLCWAKQLKTGTDLRRAYRIVCDLVQSKSQLQLTWPPGWTIQLACDAYRTQSVADKLSWCMRPWGWPDIMTEPKTLDDICKYIRLV